MFERFLPKFSVVELNLSTAHLIGHVIAQSPAKEDAITTVEKNGYKFVENGLIVGLGADGCIANYDADKHSQPCLVYTDELITGPFDSLDQFAHEVVNGEVYVRALPLYLNDSFTTDNFAGEKGTYAKVVNGVLTLTETLDADVLFIAKATTLPSRKAAYEFTFIGSAPRA